MLNSNLVWKDSDGFRESCALLAWITAHGLQGSPPWGTAMEGLDVVRFQWSGRCCLEHRHQGLPVREEPVRVFIGCSKIKGKLLCNINWFRIFHMPSNPPGSKYTIWWPFSKFSRLCDHQHHKSAFRTFPSPPKDVSCSFWVSSSTTTPPRAPTVTCLPKQPFSYILHTFPGNCLSVLTSPLTLHSSVGMASVPGCFLSLSLMFWGCWRDSMCKSSLALLQNSILFHECTPMCSNTNW